MTLKDKDFVAISLFVATVRCDKATRPISDLSVHTPPQLRADFIFTANDVLLTIYSLIFSTYTLSNLTLKTCFSLLH
jgi:hypothetical protein